MKAPLLFTLLLTSFSLVRINERAPQTAGGMVDMPGIGGTAPFTLTIVENGAELKNKPNAISG
jgi:hypothetical protein